MYVINRMLPVLKCCQLSMLPVANCQFILSQRLRVSFHNLVNPVNPVKKVRLSALASLGVFAFLWVANPHKGRLPAFVPLGLKKKMRILCGKFEYH